MPTPGQRIDDDYAKAQLHEQLVLAKEAMGPVLEDTGAYIAALAMPVRENALVVMRNAKDPFGFEDSGKDRLWRGSHFFKVGDKGLLLSSLRIEDQKKGLGRIVGTHVTINSHLAVSTEGRGPRRESRISTYAGQREASSEHILRSRFDAEPKSDVSDYESPDQLRMDYARSCLAKSASAAFIHAMMQRAVDALGKRPMEAKLPDGLEKRLKSGLGEIEAQLKAAADASVVRAVTGK